MNQDGRKKLITVHCLIHPAYTCHAMFTLQEELLGRSLRFCLRHRMYQMIDCSLLSYRKLQDQSLTVYDKTCRPTDLPHLNDMSSSIYYRASTGGAINDACTRKLPLSMLNGRKRTFGRFKPSSLVVRGEDGLLFRTMVWPLRSVLLK
jgi:hypothetical protein